MTAWTRDSRLDAVDRVTGSELLARVAIHGEDDEVGRVALARCEAVEHLRQVAEQATSRELAALSVDRIGRHLDAHSDAELCRQLARESPSSELRCAAVERIADSQLLEELARYDSDFTVRVAAVRRIDDRSLLTQLAAEDWSEDVRHCARKRLEAGD